MKLGLVGDGRMGEAVRRQAGKRGHRISAVFDIGNRLSADSDLRGARVLIDFSSENAVADNLRAAAGLGVPIVEGTTGWSGAEEILAQMPGLTAVCSPNFSIGVYFFTRLVIAAAEGIGRSGAYDVYLNEWHHRGKKDSPSGTALKLAGILRDNFPDKSTLQTSRCDGAISASALHVTSTRAGRIPGIHEIGFDSEFDSITLTHRAHNRDGFAYGAVRAAEWICDRKGLYFMDDFIASLV